ncbi:MAG: hemin uptake protein HemP [Litoreibacter sp.]|uniref:hemin uptake protein HemP n=1 Tax=Litoreibacter sp. TaxID=1969459 RepID=UPI003297F793
MTFHLAKEVMNPVTNTLPTYSAQDLTKSGDQAQIVLGEQIYTLRITRAGKLILTK